MKITIDRNYTLVSKDELSIVRVSIVSLSDNLKMVLIQNISKTFFPASLRRKIYVHYRMLFPNPDGLIYTSKIVMFGIINARNMDTFNIFLKSDIKSWLEIG
ncbi:MAG TPA: hypothetical protein VM577_12405 [Anaerovoracaceae bacterium]|nr:hypothetical protein [Anaerovoracaceae bacterium]